MSASNRLRAEYHTALIQDSKDQAAWEALYRDLHPFVRARLSGAWQGHAASIDDLVQEVFLRLVQYRPFARLPSERALLSYVWSICRNVTYDRLKVVTPERLAGTVLHPSADSPIAKMEDLDTFAALRTRLGDDRERELFDLLIRGASYPDIAATLGISEVNARVRASRLRKKLGEWLDRMQGH